jgi:hypothetical protein
MDVLLPCPRCVEECGILKKSLNFKRMEKYGIWNKVIRLKRVEKYGI